MALPKFEPTRDEELLAFFAFLHAHLNSSYLADVGADVQQNGDLIADGFLRQQPVGLWHYRLQIRQKPTSVGMISAAPKHRKFVFAIGV